MLSLDTQQIAETLVAFANTNGGWLIFDDNHSDDLKSTLSAIAVECLPTIDFHDLEPKKFYVPRSMMLHALADGRVMGRSRNKNQELTGEQIRRLAHAKNLGDFEREVVRGVQVNDFSDDLVQKFVENQSSADYLTQIGAVTQKNQPTVAGVLLFTECPQQWLPQARIEVTHWLGSSKKMSYRVTHQTFGGALITQLEEVASYLEKTLVVGSTPIYPPLALREVLLNALTHREYRAQHPIEIHIYDDCLEIKNPGGLAGFVTLEGIGQYNYQRNPQITQVLTGRGEKIGLVGVTQHRQTEFSLQNNQFSVRLYKKFLNSIASPTPLNWRQQRALEYIQEHGSITLRILCVLCVDIAREILEEDLMALVKQDLLLQLGGAIYVLKTH